MSNRFPGRRLSKLRLGILVIVLLGLTGGSYLGLRSFQDANAASSIPSVFSGYVDVTATPRFAFESPNSAEAKGAVLSFIVSDLKNACTPSWGTAYGLAEAESALDLDRRIARLRQIGGTVSVSFGGLTNSELAVGCTDQSKLTSAYREVVERYDLRSIDLDIEGTALADTASIDRRAGAVAALQQDRKNSGKNLDVWLTLPADPAGLTQTGRDLVLRTLRSGVELAGVNIMTMDFGGSKPATQTMFQASASAADAAHTQLQSIYRENGADLGSDTAWRKLGITPMIGQNDIAGEIFTLDDAASLNGYAKSKGVGRVSMWSLNRDRTCGSNYPDVAKVSDSCSGIQQGDALFSTVLGADVIPTRAAQAPAPAASTAASPAPTATDDPATSPYPVWKETARYVAGDRAVWHGNVYEAKWWTQGASPDNPVDQGATVPWKLIGPVLPGDRPSPQATIAAGTYPDWSPTAAYLRGSRILFDGYAFEAKWWTQSNSPQASLDGAPDSPWMKLTAAQLQTPAAK
ncbi:chitinase [Arthrobacter sp. 2YAF22_2]|uniref:chitinase n=1 Tax=Arthrobacter sp. 2YAF22_2 TaxID=3233029 RepID=UPI003F8FF05D